MLSPSGRLTALLLASSSCAAGCASLDLPLPDRAERAPAVAISVEEVPAEDAWELGYSLGAPARGVELLGPGTAFRRESWGVAVSRGEASWRVEGGRERLCFSRPVPTFSVAFRTGSVPPPEEPGLELAFSEGSRLLDTGHLLVRPLESCDLEAARGPESDPSFRFTFRTTAERTVRLPGAAAAEELRWEPPPGGEAATLVLFGDLEAIEGGAATVVLDPGLPGWLRAQMAAAVPRLVERLPPGTGATVPVRPLVFVTWGGGEGPGASLSASARPGVLLASARGSGWAEETPEARREWLDRIAREIFRLRILEAPPPDEASGWLPEAAAGHFAGEAAVAFGARDETEARRRLVARANDCLVRLAGRSLQAAAESDPGAWSSCGAVALAAADGALRRAAPPSDLAALFGRLFEHAAATGGYDARALVGGLQELGAEPGAVADVRWLLRGEGAAEGDRFLQRLLRHAGVATERVALADATADPETVAEAVARAVGRCYCGTGEATSCDPVTTGRQAASLAGEPIAGDPLSAWQRLQAAIARGAALPVVLAGDEVTLFCTEDAFAPTWRTLLAPAEP